MFRGKLAVFNFGVKLQLGFDLRMGFKLQPIFLQFFSRLQICPLYMFGNKATDGNYLLWNPMDLNIGFKSLALIQGQIYNPVSQRFFWILSTVLWQTVLV